jgi:hypothetical protein
MIVEAAVRINVVTGVAEEEVTIVKVGVSHAKAEGDLLAGTVRLRARMPFSRPMAQPTVKREPRVPLGLRDLLVSPGLHRHLVNPEPRVRHVLLKVRKVRVSCVWS